MFFSIIKRIKRYTIYLILIILFSYSLTIHLLICKNDCSTCNGNKELYFNRPTIYLITPTYDRLEQLAELTRLSQTLLLVNKLHWIIVEDAPSKTIKVKQFIANLLIQKKPRFQSDIKIEHFNIETPANYKILLNQPIWSKPKGVWQRNLALEYLSNNFVNLDHEGLIYFMDDDNTYDVQIFEEMRSTKKVSIWPVGLAGQLLVEKPILNSQNKVIGFNSVWKPERRYPIDMASFAIKLSFYILKSSPKFNSDLPIGYQETYLLDQLLDNYSQLEPKADNCSSIYVWHTQTVRFKVSKRKPKNYFFSN